MSNDIRNLLNIKDPHIQFPKNCVEKVGEILHIHCSLSYPVFQCPECHAHDSVVRNGDRCSKITYLDCGGQACYLLLKKQRYLYQHCHHCFTAQTLLVQKHYHISLPTKQRIAS